MNPAPIALLITALALGVGALVFGGLIPRGAMGSGRPILTPPMVWIGVAVAVVLLGLFVFPRLLGFTFLLLPFIWMRTGGRPPGRRPRAPEE
jgi:hypothetical protein